MLASRSVLELCGESGAAGGAEPEKKCRTTSESAVMPADGKEAPGREKGNVSCRMEDLLSIEDEVRNAAYKIIEAKNATYYGIGMAMTRITRAIFGNENSVLTVSAMLRGEYGQNRVFTGVPAIIGSNGIARVLELPLNAGEQKKLDESCEKLKTYYDDLKLE